MSSLIDFIGEDASEIPQFLPLFHSCNGVVTEKILKGKKLQTTKCKVFNRDLLYFFYGKPAYLVLDKDALAQNTTDVNMCPVCFVIDINKIDVSEIYPFDTGAFMGNRYKAFAFSPEENELRNEFALGKDIDIIPKYVSTFFSSNENYLVGESTIYTEGRYINSENTGKIKKNEIEPSVLKLIEMFNCSGEFNIDERSRTVEVISGASVDILDAVEAIIMPNNLRDNKTVNQFFINNPNIRCITYCFRALNTVERYYEDVFQKAMVFIDEKKEKR